ncbi:MAG: alpha/beta fold hydrolase [Proteobacteria bacterium]|nr:alpha/beta fold hydrolase [Pseudomonadota bacterium]MBS0462616.1 alpha/beta fold hydrolase [Pseudomonadota bacterium]MBS0464659.1 alpha/beta fold hydrolase [Pseudomonadota bacterium]
MSGSSEFFLPGGGDGVLLIHGLTGTPAEMRFVGKGLNREGYSVLGMQLAGHCGSEDDLLATGWRDWYASVRDAADRLAARVDRMYVGGLSMGAILALKLAAERPQQVHGLALYGTTFAYDGWTIPAIARLSFLLPLAMRLGIGRKRKFMEKPPYGIKCERVRQRIAGSMLAGDSAAGGLPGNPWPSLAEFYRLSARVRRQLDRVRAPCLVVHASNDDIASVRNARIVEQQVQSEVETMLLHDSYHMVTVDQEHRQVVARSADFFARCTAARVSGQRVAVAVA